MRWAAITIAALAFASSVDAQGKGNDKDNRGKGVVKETRRSGGGDERREVARQSRGTVRDIDAPRTERVDNRKRGNAGNDDNRGRGNAFGRSDERIPIREVVVDGEVEPVTFRTLVVSPRRGNQAVGRAISRATTRGVGDDMFVIQPVDNRIKVLNRSGAVLVDWDDDRELGNWKVVTTPFNDRRGAPSFCRSGAGHPVWGRQWCVDKGFGLGVDNDVRWARIIEPGDIRIVQPTTGDLTRDVLLGVLGDVVLNRLATHAITLGWQDPLNGRWLGDPSVPGSRVLLVSSGPRPVAEVVDLNNDSRADMVIVAVRP